MNINLIDARHINACPKMSLSPTHYRDDGTCLCDEHLVVTVTIPRDSEGTAYRLTLPDGETRIIDETGDDYCELAGIIDETFAD